MEGNNKNVGFLPTESQDVVTMIMGVCLFFFLVLFVAIKIEQSNIDERFNKFKNLETAMCTVSYEVVTSSDRRHRIQILEVPKTRKLINIIMVTKESVYDDNGFSYDISNCSPSMEYSKMIKGKQNG